MADQLCGVWYLSLVDEALADGLVAMERVLSALDTIYSLNVLRFGGGRLGAVNGMSPDGAIDYSHIQSDEMWVGTSYALASFFVRRGEIAKGMEIAMGCYDACYNRMALQYQTPEALYEKRFYREIGYMRPLSIWAIYSALRQIGYLGSGEAGK